MNGLPGRPVPALWRHRDFMLLWGGQTVSEIGSAVTVIALPLTAVVVLHATTFQVGVLTAMATAAFGLWVFFSPLRTMRDVPVPAWRRPPGIPAAGEGIAVAGEGPPVTADSREPGVTPP